MVIDTSYLINSRDRDSGDPDNFIIQNTLNLKKYKAVRIRRVTIPLSYYNIKSDAKTLSIDIGGGDVTAVMTEGSYSTITAIATELQTQLILHDATFTATANTTTNRLTIARTGAFDINLASSDSELTTILGFASTGTLTGVATYTGTKNFIVDQNISLHLAIRKLNRSTAQSTDTILDRIVSIPVDQSLGGVVNYYPPVEEVFVLDPQVNLTTFRIQFLDTYGNAIDFNGLDTEIDLIFIR